MCRISFDIQKNDTIANCPFKCRHTVEQPLTRSPRLTLSDARSDSDDVATRRERSDFEVENAAIIGRANEQSNVTGLRSTQSNCQFSVAIERGDVLNKLTMPATQSVQLSQQFSAEAGAQLSFDYVVELRRPHSVMDGCCSVGVYLICKSASPSTTLLIRKTHESLRETAQYASTSREFASFTISQTSQYRLLFVVEVDDRVQGAFARLFIDAVQVASKTETLSLASFGCLGSVRLRPDPSQKLRADVCQY